MSPDTEEIHRAPTRPAPRLDPRKRPGWRPSDLWLLVRLTVLRSTEDKIPKLAAALAYYTAFAVAPVLLIAIAVAGMVFGEDAARGAVSRQISDLVGPKIGESVETLLKNAWQPTAGLLATGLGVLALLFGASGVFVELQDSLNIIWKVKKKAGRGVWGTIRDRFLSFTMVLGIGFLLLVSLALSAGLEALSQALIRDRGQTLMLRLINPVLSLLVISALFGAAFKVLPDARTRWRDVVMGGLLTGLLFTLGKFLIGLYLGRNIVGSTYGAAGSFVLLLLWIYYSSQIFYLGAEFTRAWADLRGDSPTPDTDAIAADQHMPSGRERPSDS